MTASENTPTTGKDASEHCTGETEKGPIFGPINSGIIAVDGFTDSTIVEGEPEIDVTPYTVDGRVDCVKMNIYDEMAISLILERADARELAQLLVAAVEHRPGEEDQ